MTNIRRPRVAAIGFDDSQVESITQLCGDLRTAVSLADYLGRYSWSETDIVVSSQPDHCSITGAVHLLTIGPSFFDWRLPHTDQPGASSTQRVQSSIANTERELSIPDECPALYGTLATRLSQDLRDVAFAPQVISTTTDRFEDRAILITTTSDNPVALRLLHLHREAELNYGQLGFIALILPAAAKLEAWFPAFLADVHDIDPDRVPQKPPRIGTPSDWYTPEERALATQIDKTTLELSGLRMCLEDLQAGLAAAGETADRGIRRAIWADGEDLVAAVSEILADLGFKIQDMDARLKPHEPKREDLRLRLDGRDGWEAIVEVKGYAHGIRTNDTRQINEHTKRYIIENGRQPDLILWLTNPYRHVDPSSRPVPDSNVDDAAANIDAVHVLAADLYKRWTLVNAGTLAADDVVQDLINATPGIWTPTASDGSA